MAVSTRLIKRRIKSIKNTRKITKAMELVAASKMKRTVQLTLASRSYAETVKKLVRDISHLVDPRMHHLLIGQADTTHPNVTKTLVVLCTSDRGLCGGFNTLCLKKAFEFISSRSQEELTIVTVGKRAERAAKRLGLRILASFEAISNAPSFLRSKPLGSLVVDEFVKKNVERVFMVYMDFRSALSQVPTIEQLLPIIPEAELAHARSRISEEYETQESAITFEPNPNDVLEQLLPKLVETRVYQALLESSASEHSSRMMAMRSATDNATDMIDGLTLSFNQARQAIITQEISEISAGKAAIE